MNRGSREGGEGATGWEGVCLPSKLLPWLRVFSEDPPWIKSEVFQRRTAVLPKAVTVILSSDKR